MDVSDLLLLLGSFGGECTREAVVEAPTEPTWFDENADPSALATWGHAVDFCAAVGGELCTYATACEVQLHCLLARRGPAAHAPLARQYASFC